jgi:hypothetical protein
MGQLCPLCPFFCVLHFRGIMLCRYIQLVEKQGSGSRQNNGKLCRVASFARSAEARLSKTWGEVQNIPQIHDNKRMPSWALTGSVLKYERNMFQCKAMQTVNKQ